MRLRALSYRTMPNAYYTCHLLPLGLIRASGFVPCWLGGRLQDPPFSPHRDALSLHPNTCPYVTRLATAAESVLDGNPEDVIIIPGGCDAMRRLGDLLAAVHGDRVFVLSLPRASSEAEVDSLSYDIAAMEAWLAQKARIADRLPADARPETTAGPSAADERPGTAAGAAASTLPAVSPPPSGHPPLPDYPCSPEPGGVFVVGGPLSDDSLLRLLLQLGAKVAGLESCTSPDRWRPLQLVGAVDAEPTDPAADSPAAAPPRAPHRELARQVLALGMCPRFSTAERRAYLARRFQQARPSSVIYARQTFCDPGAYDALLVADLAAEHGLPFLELEVGFPLETTGPLRTRVEAFLEAQLLEEDLLDAELFALDPSPGEK